MAFGRDNFHGYTNEMGEIVCVFGREEGRRLRFVDTWEFDMVFIKKDAVMDNGERKVTFIYLHSIYLAL